MELLVIIKEEVASTFKNCIVIIKRVHLVVFRMVSRLDVMSLITVIRILNKISFSICKHLIKDKIKMYRATHLIILTTSCIRISSKHQATMEAMDNIV